MAVVIDTGSVSRGSGAQGSNRERDIRKEFVDKDLIESVILLPENMFYNTSAPGVIITINKNKKNKGEILLINASKLFKKGRPKNYLTEGAINKIYDIYLNWKEEKNLSKIVKNVNCEKNDYNLSPSRYVSDEIIDDILPLEKAVFLLEKSEKERKEVDKKLKMILRELNIKND